MPPREVAEPKKTDGCENEFGGPYAGAAVVLCFIVVIVMTVFMSSIHYKLGANSVWVEAEKRGFAERAYQTSAGEVYHWKSPTDLQHIRLFWEEAVRRGFAERAEWPEGLGEFRWKESNENTTDR